MFPYAAVRFVDDYDCTSVRMYDHRVFSLLHLSIVLCGRRDDKMKMRTNANFSAFEDRQCYFDLPSGCFDNDIENTRCKTLIIVAHGH